MATTTMRSVWADKFREPSGEALLDGLSGKVESAVAELVRGGSMAMNGVSEQVKWLATPWRWTMVYSCELDPTRALAYLIPDPSKVQVCVPLTMSMIQSMPLKRLKKGIRDGIIYSKVVADTFWPTWELANRAAAEDVLDLIARKHKYITAGQAQMAAIA